MSAPNPGRYREHLVSAENFQVIRQLTLELANVPREPMVELGWNPKNGDYLKQLARSVPSQITAPTRVKLVILDEEINDPTSPGRSSVAEEEPESPSDIVRYLPKSIAAMYPKLLRAAFEALGEPETRYRTGFYEGEVVEALNAIDGVSGN
ncbi:hypothetical protein OH799_16480 [Nocardia sp. NBC_00881]|uniref:hypothetical protein n=1 Tax=Nocardia sp. NBC_00881 TaxID=2975995 RepID=UPI003869AF0E|nr:hypothetical protein OH799_16480 [Nocardia sp. NBC_00881]